MRSLTFGLLLAFASSAFGQDMPKCQTASPCRIIILSAEEEQALMGEKMILDSALNGRMLDMIGPVLYFRRKIEQAPRGLPPDPPKQP